MGEVPMYGTVSVCVSTPKEDAKEEAARLGVYRGTSLIRKLPSP